MDNKQSSWPSVYCPCPNGDTDTPPLSPPIVLKLSLWQCVQCLDSPSIDLSHLWTVQDHLQPCDWLWQENKSLLLVTNHLEQFQDCPCHTLKMLRLFHDDRGSIHETLKTEIKFYFNMRVSGDDSEFSWAGCKLVLKSHDNPQIMADNILIQDEKLAQSINYESIQTGSHIYNEILFKIPPIELCH